MYLESIINHGNRLIKLTIDAPIPSATNNVGKAQQIKVLRLVNRLMEGEINCLNLLPITVYLSYIIPESVITFVIMSSFKLLPFFKLIVISISSKFTLILFTDSFLLKSFSIERAQKSHTSPLTEYLVLHFLTFLVI